MNDKEVIFELQAELHGVRLMVGMMLNSAPDIEGLPERIKSVEDGLRVQGGHSGTIETLRSYREMLEAKAADL